MDTEILSTAQAAQRLKVTRWWILGLIRQGRLPATKFGRDWMIRADDLAKFAQQPRQVGYPRGRPRK